MELGRFVTRLSGRLLRSGRVLRTLARLGGPRMAAAAIAWLTSRHAWPSGALTVLWSVRPHFRKDIDELAARTDMAFVPLSKTYVQMVLEAWVPWEMRRQVHFQAARGPRAERARRLSTAFARALLLRLRRKRRIDAVLTANINYWQDDALCRACRELGIPFLVLSREQPLSPVAADWIRLLNGLHRFRFEGDGVAVFGRQTRDALTESGACTEDQVWITGAPRFDRWRDIRFDGVVQDTVTLMSYGEQTYFAPQNYREAVAACGRASRQAAAECGVRFILKCKNEFNIELAGRILADVPGHRVVLDMHASLYELFPRSRIVAGFNSFSLIEALLGAAPVVVPNWGDSRRPTEELVFDPDDESLRGAVAFATSAEDFEARIAAVVARPPGPVDSAQRRRIVGRYCHFSEGETASAAVARFIGHYVDAAGRGAVKPMAGVVDESVACPAGS